MKNLNNLLTEGYEIGMNRGEYKDFIINISFLKEGEKEYKSIFIESTNLNNAKNLARLFALTKYSITDISIDKIEVL